MSVRTMSRVAVAGCMCGILLMAAGCRTRGQKTGSDMVGGPDPLAGDVALSQRFEDGVRITDVKFEAVLFSYDSFQMDPSEVAKIEPVAAYMRDNGAVRLITEGHCDERGSSEYNMALGEHRALAVRAHLVGLGIDGSRIQTRSYGEESPANAGHDESAWRLNRRVEFALFR